MSRSAGAAGWDWVPVPGSGHLEAGAAAVVRRDGIEVAVFDVHGELVAVDNRCLHRGGSLADGTVRDGVVTCPLHWWRYDLRTGERLGAPELCLDRYEVRATDDGTVEVLLPPPRPVRSMREVLLEHARRARPVPPGSA